MRGRHTFFERVVALRGVVLLVAAATIGLAAVGASGIRVDYGVEQLLPSWGAERRVYDEYKALFPREDLRFSLFWDDDRPMGTAVLADMARAVAAFRDVGLEEIQWVGDLPVPGGQVGRPGGEPRTLIAWSGDPAGPEDRDLRAALGRLREDPLYRGVLWDGRQRVWAVHGFLDPASNTDAGRREVEQTLTAALDSLGIGEARLVLSGVPVLRSRIPLLLEADQSLFLGGGAVLFFGLLLLFLGRPTHVVVCLASVLPAYLCTVGLMAATGRPVSILTSFMPIVVLIVGVSDAIHLVLGWRRHRTGGLGAKEAVVEIFAELAPSCFYTSLTTAVGFAALAGTGIGVVVEFGLFTALSIVLTYAFGMTVLPALLSFARGTLPEEEGRIRAAARGWMAPILDAADSRRTPRGVIAAFAVVGAGCLILGTTLRVDTYLVDDLEDDSAVMRDLRWIEDRGFGLFQINVLVRGPAGGLHGPETLGWMEELEAFGRRDPLVLGAVGLPDVATGLARAGRGRAPAAGRRPVAPSPVAEALDAAIAGDPGFAADLYRPAAGAAQVVFTVKDAGSQATLPFLDRLDDWLEAHPPPVGEAASTGLVRLFQGYTSRILSSFGPSLILAGLLIFGVMTFMFRSVRLGLLAMVPNLFPLAVLVGLMGAGGIAVKPSTVLVFSIAFSIAVDDSIHFLAAFRRGQDGGLGLAGALGRAVREAGPAILVTTVVVSAGFSLLLLSRFQVLFLVGFLTLVSSLAAVAADLFLFPSLLRAAIGSSPTVAVAGDGRRPAAADTH